MLPFLLPPNDELAFARAIVPLMDDPELRKIGLDGRKRVENELQWSVTGRNLLAAYKTFLTGPSGDERVECQVSDFQRQE